MQEKVEIITNQFEHYWTKIPKNGYCVWEGTGAVQDDKYLNGNNSEGITIFGKNDTDMDGMTIIWTE